MKKFEDYISLYVDGDLAENETEELMAHISQCPDCAELLKIYGVMRDLLGGDGDIEPPEELSERVMAAVEEVSARSKSKRRKVIFLRIGAIAACAALAVLGIKALPSSKAKLSSYAPSESVSLTGAAFDSSDALFYADGAGDTVREDDFVPTEGAGGARMQAAAPGSDTEYASDESAGSHESYANSLDPDCGIPAESPFSDEDIALEVYVTGELPPELAEGSWVVYPTQDVTLYNMYIPAETAEALAAAYGYESVFVTQGASMARIVLTEKQISD